jgi:hypothetical protein
LLIIINTFNTFNTIIIINTINTINKMMYKDFVREMFAKHKGKMTAKEIMKLAAEQWPAVRDGGKMKSAPKKQMKRGGALSKANKGIFSDIGNAISSVGAVMDPIVSLASGRGMKAKKASKPRGRGVVGGGPVGGGVSGGSILGDILGFGLEKGKMNVIPKNPTKKLSTFYQFETLPTSNYAPSLAGGSLMGRDGKAMDPAHGAGLFDNILPLLPFAML